MSPTANVSTDQAAAIVDTVVKDLFVAGVLAASIFVKNPDHRIQAAQITGVLQSLLPMLDPNFGK